MCFFTAAVTGAAGIAAVTRAHAREDMPPASIPLVFAVQQSLEGLLWLNLPARPDSSASTRSKVPSRSHQAQP